MSASPLPIGHRVIRVDSVDSTNSLAATLIPETNAHGTVITAQIQTAGRGQYGRSWISHAGDSLLFSVILRPLIELRRPVILTAWAAVALGDAILAMTGLQSRIKWPNDLLLRGKKVSGILIEGSNDAVVVGVGLNLNQSRDGFDAAGLPDATSLSLSANRPFEVEGALQSVLVHLNREWDRLCGGERVAVEAEWKWRIGLQGNPVAVEGYDGIITTGRLLDMSFEGIEICRDSGVASVFQPEVIRHIRAL